MSDAFKNKALLFKLNELGYKVEGIVSEEYIRFQTLYYYFKFEYENCFIYFTCDSSAIDQGNYEDISKEIQRFSIMLFKANRDKKGLYKFICYQLNTMLYYKYDSKLFGKHDEWYEYCENLSKLYKNGDEFLQDLENIDLTNFIEAR